MGFVYRGVYCDISINFGDFRILYCYKYYLIR